MFIKKIVFSFFVLFSFHTTFAFESDVNEMQEMLTLFENLISTSSNDLDLSEAKELLEEMQKNLDLISKSESFFFALLYTMAPTITEENNIATPSYELASYMSEAQMWMDFLLKLKNVWVSQIETFFLVAKDHPKVKKNPELIQTILDSSQQFLNESKKNYTRLFKRSVSFIEFSLFA